MEKNLRVNVEDATTTKGTKVRQIVTYTGIRDNEGKYEFCTLGGFLNHAAISEVLDKVNFDDVLNLAKISYINSELKKMDDSGNLKLLTTPEKEVQFETFCGAYKDEMKKSFKNLFTLRGNEFIKEAREAEKLRIQREKEKEFKNLCESFNLTEENIQALFEKMQAIKK